MLILADRTSHLESISRQETQGALECHQIALEDMRHRITCLEAATVQRDDWLECARYKHLIEISKNGRSLIVGSTR